MRRNIILVVFFFLVFWTGFQLALTPGSSSLLSIDYWRNLNTIGQVMRIIRSDHVDGADIQYHDLSSPAIREMIESLDEYSGYMSNREFQAFETQTRQEYVGIGVEIAQRNGEVSITQVFSGSPAGEAGLVGSEVILAIDEESAEDFGIQEVVARVRGKPGTSLSLKVRQFNGNEKTVTIERRAIEIASIRDIQLRDDGIGYLHIQNYGMRTARELMEALNGFMEGGASGIIIDLRDNPGGMLQAAIDTTSHFLEKGDLIVSTRGRTRQREHSYFAEGGDWPKDFPLVILINGNSASASEIMAGALRDHSRATLVGETSRGKGSVQTVFSMRTGGGVRLTTAMYFLPGGDTIHEIGVEPDIVIETEREERQKLFLQRQHRHRFTPEQFEKEFGFSFMEDRQLQAAVDYLLNSVALVH